ncbi:hypothetical protein R84981_000515 [Carnimonas sp. R-84981]
MVSIVGLELDAPFLPQAESRLQTQAHEDMRGGDSIQPIAQLLGLDFIDHIVPFENAQLGVVCRQNSCLANLLDPPV